MSSTTISDSIGETLITSLHTEHQEVIVQPSVELEKTKIQNQECIQSLETTYSAPAVSHVFSKIEAGKQEQIASGKLSLLSYLPSIKKQCELFQAKADQVKIENQQAIARLVSKYSKPIVKAVINSIDAIQKEKLQRGILPIQEISVELEDNCKKAQQTQQENRELMDHLATRYSKEVFDTVYAQIEQTKRDSIELGMLPLKKYLPVLNKKCDELVIRQSAKESAKVGVLPSKEELPLFFEKAKLIKYLPGAQGAFFFQGSYQGKPLCLVVKAPEKPNQEAFATELLSEMQVKTPNSLFIGQKDPAYQKILSLLQADVNFKKNYKETLPEQLNIMSYVPGVNLEEIGDKDLGSPSTEKGIKNLLFDIGKIGGADLLLYYQDRLPIIGMANLANIMVLKDTEGACTGAVAIDQVADLSKEKLAKRKIDPFKTVSSVVKDIVASPKTISEAAKDIFESLPDALQGKLKKSEALASLQEGIVQGISQAAALTPKTIETISKSLITSSKPHDTVHVADYQKMLSTMQESALS